MTLRLFEMVQVEQSLEKRSSRRGTSKRTFPNSLKYLKFFLPNFDDTTDRHCIVVSIERYTLDEIHVNKRIAVFLAPNNQQNLCLC